MTSVKEVLSADVEAVKSQIAHLEQLVESCDECAHYAPILEERREKHRLLSAMLALEVSPAAGTLQDMLRTDIAVSEQQIKLFDEYKARFGLDSVYTATLEKKQEKLRKLTALLVLEPKSAGSLQGTLEQHQQLQQQLQLRPSSMDAKRGRSPDDGPECSDSKRQRQQHSTAADGSGGCGGSTQRADGSQPHSLPGTQSPQQSHSERQRPQPQHPSTPDQAGSHPHGLVASMAAAAPAAPAAAGPSVLPGARTLPAHPSHLPERPKPVSSASEGMTIAIPAAAEAPAVGRHSSTGAQAAAAPAEVPVHALEDSIQCDNGRLRLPAWLILQNGIASCHEVTVVAHPSGSTFSNVPKRLGTAGQYISKRDWAPIARNLGVQDAAFVTAWCQDSEPQGTFHVARAQGVWSQTAKPQQQQALHQSPAQPQQPAPPGPQPPRQPPGQPPGAQQLPMQTAPAQQQPEQQAPAQQEAAGAGAGAGGTQQAGPSDDATLQPRRAALQAQGIWQAVVLQDQVLDEALQPVNPPTAGGNGCSGGSGGGGQSQSWQGGMLPGGGWAGIAAALPHSGSRRRTLRPPVPCGSVGIKVNMKKQPGRLYVSADYTWLLCQGRRRPDACTFIATDGEHSVRKEVKFRNSAAGVPTPFPGMEAVEGWNTICTFLGLREHSVIGLCWRGTVPDEVEVVKVDHGPSSWVPPEVPHWAKLAYSAAGDCVGGGLTDAAAPAAAVAGGCATAVPMGVSFVADQAAAAGTPAGAAAPGATAAAAQRQPSQMSAPVAASPADPLPSAANRDPRRAAAAAAAASDSPPPGSPPAAGGWDAGARRMKQESPPAADPLPPYRLLLEGRLGPQEPSAANLRAFMAAALAAMRGGKDAWPFLEPVSAAAVPNYYHIIKNPMDMRTIGERMERGYYRSLHTFAEDFRRIFANARTFNPPRTFFYKAADKLESSFNTYIGARIL